jgi:hypothetical protein
VPPKSVSCGDECLLALGAVVHSEKMLWHYIQITLQH